LILVSVNLPVRKFTRTERKIYHCFKNFRLYSITSKNFQGNVSNSNSDFLGDHKLVRNWRNSVSTLSKARWHDDWMLQWKTTSRQKYNWREKTAERTRKFCFLVARHQSSASTEKLRSNIVISNTENYILTVSLLPRFKKGTVMTTLLKCSTRYGELKTQEIFWLHAFPFTFRDLPIWASHSAADWARELFKPSKYAESLVISIFLNWEVLELHFFVGDDLGQVLGDVIGPTVNFSFF